MTFDLKSCYLKSCDLKSCDLPSRGRGRFFPNHAVAIALFAASLAPASAATITFTDRATFLASAGPTTTETFDTTTVDQFRTQVINVGPFTLTGFGTNQTISGDPYNEIEPPGTFYDVNGSRNVLGITNVGGTGFTITFNSPVVSFGADFAGFNNRDIVPRSRIVVNGSDLSPPVVDGNALSFFGFISDTPFTEVSFLRNPDYTRPDSSDVFGMDNVTFAGVPAAPEPATWAMMILGFAGIGVVTWRRKTGLTAVTTA